MTTKTLQRMSMTLDWPPWWNGEAGRIWTVGHMGQQCYVPVSCRHYCGPCWYRVLSHMLYGWTPVFWHYQVLQHFSLSEGFGDNSLAPATSIIYSPFQQLHSTIIIWKIYQRDTRNKSSSTRRVREVRQWWQHRITPLPEKSDFSAMQSSSCTNLEAANSLLSPPSLPSFKLLLGTFCFTDLTSPHKAHSEFAHIPVKWV